MYVNRKIMLLVAGVVLFLLSLVIFVTVASGVVGSVGGILKDAISSVPIISAL